MATELTLVCLFEQDEDDLNIEQIVRHVERTLDCDVTEWDSQEV